MASIKDSNITSSSVTLELIDLDTSWGGGTRTVYWYLSASGIPTESNYDVKSTTTISGSPSTGGKVTITSLQADTTYYVYCTVYSGTTFLKSFSTIFITSANTTGRPTVTSCTYQAKTGSRVITVNLVGTNIKGYTVTLGLSYTDGTAQTIISKIPITSNSFSTTITAASYATATLSVVFDPGGAYAKVYNFTDVELDGGDDSEYFEWSSAVAKGLPIKNVSHTEWDNFIDKIVEVLGGNLYVPLGVEKYGYSASTTYFTMLQDCYMDYDSSYQGYPLTAKMFNVARFIIGSFVQGGSGISEDKISRQSKVLASDLIKLADRLQDWQDQ